MRITARTNVAIREIIIFSIFLTGNLSLKNFENFRNLSIFFFFFGLRNLILNFIFAKKFVKTNNFEYYSALRNLHVNSSVVTRIIILSNFGNSRNSHLNLGMQKILFFQPFFWPRKFACEFICVNKIIKSNHSINFASRIFFVGKFACKFRNVKRLFFSNCKKIYPYFFGVWHKTSRKFFFFLQKEQIKACLSKIRSNFYEPIITSESNKYYASLLSFKKSALFSLRRAFQLREKNIICGIFLFVCFSRWGIQIPPRGWKWYCGSRNTMSLQIFACWWYFFLLAECYQIYSHKNNRSIEDNTKLIRTTGDVIFGGIFPYHEQVRQNIQYFTRIVIF